jgi:hypothetical protein
MMVNFNTPGNFDLPQPTAHMSRLTFGEIMFRTVITAGVIALPLVTAAPALAGPGTVSCSFPCTIVGETLNNYAGLPAATVGTIPGTGYAAFIPNTIGNYGALPSTPLGNYATFLPTTLDNYANLPGTTLGNYAAFPGTTASNYANLPSTTLHNVFPGLH